MVQYGLMGLAGGLGGTRLGTIHETTIYTGLLLDRDKQVNKSKISIT
jgi:hypothetical protein